MSRRTVMLLTAMLAASGAPASAASDELVAKFEAAITFHDPRGAAKALNEIVEARLPAKDTRRPDPLLDRLFVLNADLDGSDLGTEILERVIANPATRDVGHYRLLLAANLERTGDLGAAERAYAAVARSATSAQDRLAGKLGLARIQMLDRPAVALATLHDTDQENWEAQLMSSRVARLNGDEAGARQSLERAWAIAPRALAVESAVGVAAVVPQQPRIERPADAREDWRTG